MAPGGARRLLCSAPSRLILPCNCAAAPCLPLQMKGCEAYKALCAPGSVVAQCTAPGPLAAMVPPEGGGGCRAPRGRRLASNGSRCKPSMASSCLDISSVPEGLHTWPLPPAGIDMSPAGINSTTPLWTYDVKETVDVRGLSRLAGRGELLAWGTHPAATVAAYSTTRPARRPPSLVARSSALRTPPWRPAHRAPSRAACS